MSSMSKNNTILKSRVQIQKSPVRTSNSGSKSDNEESNLNAQDINKNTKDEESISVKKKEVVSSPNKQSVMNMISSLPKMRTRPLTLQPSGQGTKKVSEPESEENVKVSPSKQSPTSRRRKVSKSESESETEEKEIPVSKKEEEKKVSVSKRPMTLQQRKVSKRKSESESESEKEEALISKKKEEEKVTPKEEKETLISKKKQAEKAPITRKPSTSKQEGGEFVKPKRGGTRQQFVSKQEERTTSKQEEGEFVKPKRGGTRQQFASKQEEYEFFKSKRLGRKEARTEVPKIRAPHLLVPEYDFKNIGQKILYRLVKIVSAFNLQNLVDFMEDLSINKSIDTEGLRVVGSARVDYHRNPPSVRNERNYSDDWDQYTENNLAIMAIHPLAFDLLHQTHYVSKQGQHGVAIQEYSVRQTNLPLEDCAPALFCSFKDSRLIPIEEQIKQMYLKMFNMVESGLVGKDMFKIHVPQVSRNESGVYRNFCIITFDEEMSLVNRAAIKVLLDKTKFRGELDEDYPDKHIPYMCRVSWAKTKIMSLIKKGPQSELSKTSQKKKPNVTKEEEEEKKEEEEEKEKEEKKEEEKKEEKEEEEEMKKTEEEMKKEKSLPKRRTQASTLPNISKMKSTTTEQ